MDKFTRQALEHYFQETGTTARELAETLGVTESTVSRWRSGTHGAWRKHEAKLKQILGDRLPSASSSVPVLGLAAAAGYDPACQPIDDYAVGHAEEFSAWPAEYVRPGMFCLRVDGDSMLPDYPPGTLLLVTGAEIPQNGDVVVARLADSGQVVVKSYARAQSVVHLTSISPEGRSYEIDLKAEPGRLAWAYPVLQAQIHYRDGARR